MEIMQKIKSETENVEIKVKDIAPHEWGEYFLGIEYYKNLHIQFDDDLLHITLSFTEGLSDKFCEEINAMWGDDRDPYYKIDLTGFWLEFPKNWDNDKNILNEIKEIAIKYYLIAKYDNPTWQRRGFDVYKYLGGEYE